MLGKGIPFAPSCEQGKFIINLWKTAGNSKGHQYQWLATISAVKVNDFEKRKAKSSTEKGITGSPMNEKMIQSNTPINTISLNFSERRDLTKR